MKTTNAIASCFCVALLVTLDAASSDAGEEQIDLIWGANGHPFAQEGYRPDTDGVPYEDQIRLLAELGMDYYRCDLGLGHERAFDWLDRLLGIGKKHNMMVLPVVFPPVDRNKEIHNPDGVYKTSFEAARKLAERFKGRIPVYDLHNELDGWCMNTDYWGKNKHPDGDELKHYFPDRLTLAAAMLRGLADGVRAGDPDAKRMINTGGWLHTGFVQAMVEADVSFEILSWHWYSDMGKIDSIEARGGRDLLGELLAFGKPIWITEANYRPGLREADQSVGEERGRMDDGCAYLRDTMKHVHKLRKRGVRAYLIYELLDEPYFLRRDPGTVEAHYGLVELVRGPNDHGWRIGRRKHAFHVVRETIESIREVDSDH